jgi:CheY-like chemotaxis protein/2-polyprenyl-3-methyl-5-hydroxy-6-metoxy-1,4-benzoquinol methylase
MGEKPIALDAFNQLADAYAARIDTKAHNAFYDRPAVLSLLPPVEGKRVLDAGCGPGVYTEWLVGRGAAVTGVDVCPRMLERARLRLGGQAAFVQADLGRPLDFLPADSFDLVLSTLTLDFVRDWDAGFREFFRVLREPGHFVFSAGHPSDEYYEHHPQGNYFEVEQVAYEWRGFGPAVMVPSYRRPLSAMLDPLLGAGFVLERLLEPRPIPTFREHDPEDYEKLMRRPGFICLRARKGAAAVPHRGKGGSTTRSRGVLVIDDSREASECLKMLLQRLGHEVRVACGGLEGIEAARSWRPEMVLCDLDMPGLSGREVARKLRENPDTASIRLVAMAAYGREEDIRQALADGFEAGLLKPIEVDQLRRLVEGPG